MNKSLVEITRELVLAKNDYEIFNEEELMERVDELFTEMHQKEDGIFWMYKEAEKEIEMFEEQMNDRHIYKYPPIYRLIKITFKHKDYNKVNLAADWYATSLRQVFKTNVLGPEFPPISRIRNLYHKNILVKIPQQQSLVKTKEAIIKINNSFFSVKDFRAIRVILNVDNY